MLFNNHRKEEENELLKQLEKLNKELNEELIEIKNTYREKIKEIDVKVETIKRERMEGIKKTVKTSLNETDYIYELNCTERHVEMYVINDENCMHIELKKQFEDEKIKMEVKAAGFHQKQDEEEIKEKVEKIKKAFGTTREYRLHFASGELFQLTIDLGVLKANFSESDTEVLNYLKKGWRFDEISQKKNISKQDIDFTFLRLKKAMKNTFPYVFLMFGNGN